MSAVRFAPWVGTQYATDGFRGLRVLLVSESFYGDSRYERPDVTAEVIKALALGLRNTHTQGKVARHPHYAKIFAAMNNRPTAGVFNRAKRAGFWDKVAYFNFIQQFLGASRDDPPSGAWARGKPAFLEVMQVLQPQLVVCFSLRNGARVRKLACDVPVAVVNHPSARFSYQRANPIIAEGFEAALSRAASLSCPPFVESLAFCRWRDDSIRAEPAGRRMPETIKLVRIARWAEQMAKIDRLAPVTLAGGRV
jgi:hypothetical protein